MVGHVLSAIGNEAETRRVMSLVRGPDNPDLPRHMKLYNHYDCGDAVTLAIVPSDSATTLPNRSFATGIIRRLLLPISHVTQGERRRESSCSADLGTFTQDSTLGRLLIRVLRARISAIACLRHLPSVNSPPLYELGVELGLIQSHMAQKPVLRGEVGCACDAREVSVDRGGMGERGCARRLGGWVWV